MAIPITLTAFLFQLAAQAAPAPWALLPVRLGEATALGTEVGGLRVDSVSFGRDERGGLTAEVRATVSAEAGGTRLALAVFDASGAPLVAGTEQLTGGSGTNPLNERALTGVVRLPLGDRSVAEAARWFAAGPVAPPHTAGDVASLSAGGSIALASSVYSQGYRAECVLDDDPGTMWASKTGAVSNEFLVVMLAGDAPVRIRGVAIDPAGEPGYPNCAVKDFAVLVSTDGTVEGDFQEVFRGQCAQPRGLQTFPIPPVEARYVKLLCLSNYGDDKWMELTTFSVLEDQVAAPAAEPVELVEDFGRATQRVRAEQTIELERLPKLQVLAPRPEVGALLLRELPEGELSFRRVPTVAYAVDLEGCKDGSFALAEIQEPGLRAVFGKLTYDFGYLLGGAPQHCGVRLDKPLRGQPRLLQFLARPEPPGNSLRVTLTDQDGEWFTWDLGKLDGRGWRLASVALDPAKAAQHGGEGANGQLDAPLRLTRISVTPKSRETLAGSLSIDEILALSAVSPPAGG
ncbi:MAG: discoidin domain-containing protein [Armatimonadetes bacterium]|nr:discoidin domain-containing protein [Armatimonadota bacterium]